ncbi:MAG: zinc metallopeptidase [Bacteroidales bacterium]|nr:zinc metallopeptidase [Bacteroidales bacterium]
MKLDGRRESTNVQDRRGMSGGAKMGLGGIVIVGLITLLMGGDLGDVFNVISSQGGITGQTSTEFTAEEQALASFSKKILAGTEDVWTRYFQKNGLGEYQSPTMVLYTGQTQSGCGTGSASMGPFYCSADQCLYIDLSFFSSMKSQLGADGDFAYAYVIAHEVGHHVQHLLGTLGQAHQQMARMSKADANKLSVRIELQADFYAGVWAHHDNEMFGSIEPGDIDEAIRCASVIGDDYLQKKAQGYAVEESFTHGTAAQRKKWLSLGIQTGDIRQGDTFSLSESQL